MPTPTVPTEPNENYIDAVKRALADAGVTVYYDSDSLDGVDLFLTPLESADDERNATVLQWHEGSGGWVIAEFAEGTVAFAQSLGLPPLADPVDVARETAARHGLGAEEPPTPRSELVAALRRLADEIEHDELPVPVFKLHVGGCVESRADVQRWADHMGGVAIRMGGTDNNIPVARREIRVTDHLALDVSFQGPAEPPSSRVAELQGGAR